VIITNVTILGSYFGSIMTLIELPKISVWNHIHSISLISLTCKDDLI